MRERPPSGWALTRRWVTRLAVAALVLSFSWEALVGELGGDGALLGRGGERP